MPQLAEQAAPGQHDSDADERGSAIGADEATTTGPDDDAATTATPDDDGDGDDDVPQDDEPVDLRCQVGDGVVPPTHEDFEGAGPYLVATLDLTLVDRLRGTPSNGDYAGDDARTLRTNVHYPSAAREPGDPLFGPTAAVDGGPFPMLVYSHGFSSNRDEGAEVASHLASHGYVVIAPTFPLSSLGAPGGPTFADLGNQPGDVSFLLDAITAKATIANDPLFEAVDPDRVGALGLSMGGLTTSLVSFHPWLADPRIDAALTMAGPSSFFSEDFYRFDPKPLLLVHGDVDAFVDYDDNATVALERAWPNVNLVTIRAGSHAGFSSIGPEILFDLLGEIVAPENAHPDNPDGVGCALVAAAIHGDLAQSGIFDALGGLAEGILLPDPDDPPSLPCDNGMVELPAIATSRQVGIAKRASLAFFDAYLVDDAIRAERACHYLGEVLGTDAAVELD